MTLQCGASQSTVLSAKQHYSSRQRYKAWRYRVWRYINLPNKTKLLLMEAAILLALARCAVLLCPFRLLGLHLGQLNCETPKANKVSQQLITRQIATVISMISPYTPWYSNCLAQAIAGKLMLRIRGIPSTLYLGLKHNTPQLEAHAWLRSGECTVTGGKISTDYTVIAFYGR